MKQFGATLTGNASLGGGFFEMTFSWERGAGNPEPGRFFTLRISESTVPLLRRPFAFSAFDQSRSLASAIFQKRGRGTELLAAKEPGERLDVIGPLGKPFSSHPSGKKAILVAGGIGLGPIVFLCAKLRERAIARRMVFGCRTRAQIPASPALEACGAEICTDDGSAGFKGTATDYLESIASETGDDSVLYCCGPLPMLKACHEFASRRGCACFVSVEQVIACGVGACMGCAVRVRGESGYARACTEGPVFDSKEIEWN